LLSALSRLNIFRNARMATKLTQAVEIQRKYYANTAGRYDSMHAGEGASDPSIFMFVHSMLRMLDVKSVLDVGTATGTAILGLKEAFPRTLVCGVEPVATLLEQAVRSGVPRGALVCAMGEALPFPDGAFDAVCEFAVLHHAENPASVVKEMLRVARRAVFICDSNRFGQGSRMARLTKLVIYKSGLWGLFNYLRTRGKRYMITEGDGLAYSYSVYDSFELVARWADRVILVPTGSGGKARSWFHPLLNSAGVLVCAIKD
jgi:ubiquinone/menaquinone biosynthesis C-methylase UbiE